jgi:CheY-like chemotaxis protein
MTTSTSKPLVLVVDDIEANRYAFEAVLEKEFDVVLAKSGREALDLCEKHDFAVVVLDVRMPGMDGFETAEVLRRREKTRLIPIVFTSAFEQTMTRMTQGYVSGATDFLFSPVDSDLLELKVRTYAQIHLRQEALRRNVQELNDAVRSLHDELARRGVAVTRVKAGLQNLEEKSEELTRTTSGVS